MNKKIILMELMIEKLKEKLEDQTDSDICEMITLQIEGLELRIDEEKRMDDMAKDYERHMEMAEIA